MQNHIASIHSSYFTSKNLQSWNPQPLSLPGNLQTPDDPGSLKVGLEPGDLTKYSGVPGKQILMNVPTSP